jgi:predicted dehydrogenase
MMNSVGFGVIGCGFIGKLHAEVIEKTAGARLVAVADLNKEAGKNCL